MACFSFLKPEVYNPPSRRSVQKQNQTAIKPSIVLRNYLMTSYFPYIAQRAVFDKGPAAVSRSSAGVSFMSLYFARKQMFSLFIQWRCVLFSVNGEACVLSYTKNGHVMPINRN